MKCDRCKQELADDEGRVLRGETLCEDCYIEAAYPAKACDPWAVYIATRNRETSGQTGAEGLTELQQAIYEFIRSRGKVTGEELMERFHLPPSEIQNQAAILRHCELIRGTKEDGKVYLTLF
jgi:recombinational DNA repair protein (RecF pathway)